MSARAASLPILLLLLLGTGLSQAASPSYFAVLPWPRALAATPERLFAISEEELACTTAKLFSIDERGVSDLLNVLPANTDICASIRQNALAVSPFDAFGKGYVYVGIDRSVYKIHPQTGQVMGNGPWVQNPNNQGSPSIVTAVTFDEGGSFGNRLLFLDGSGNVHAVSAGGSGQQPQTEFIADIDVPDFETSVSEDIEVAPLHLGPFGGHLISVTENTSTSGWTRPRVMHEILPLDRGSYETRPIDGGTTRYGESLNFVPATVCPLGTSAGAFLASYHEGARIEKFPPADFALFMRNALLTSTEVHPDPSNIRVGINEIEATYFGDNEVSHGTFHESRYPLESDQTIHGATFVPCSDKVSVFPATIREGDSGITTAAFELSLAGPNREDVTARYETRETPLVQIPAAAGADYIPVEDATVTFNPGETTKTVEVQIKGDTEVEPDETFFLALLDGDQVTSQAVGTIVNDDSPALALPEIVAPDLEIPGSAPAGGSGQPPAAPAGNPPPAAGPAGSAPGAVSGPQTTQPPPAPPSGASAPGPAGAGGQVGASGAAPTTGQAAGYVPVPGAAPPLAVAPQGSPVAIPGLQAPRQEQPGAAPETNYSMVKAGSSSGTVRFFVPAGFVMLFVFTCHMRALRGKQDARRCPAAAAVS